MFYLLLYAVWWVLTRIWMTVDLSRSKDVAAIPTPGVLLLPLVGELGLVFVVAATVNFQYQKLLKYLAARRKPSQKP